MPAAAAPSWLNIAIPLLIAAIILIIRIRRMKRARPLKLERLWVVPALYTAFAATMLWTTPPRVADLPWLAVALAIGAGIGWWRGAMMRIGIDPATHALNQQASPAAFLFLAALIVTRMALRTVLRDEIAALNVAPMFLTDLFLLFALGLLSAMHLEMFVRASRLLASARSATVGS